MENTYYIGELAKRLGLTAKAIRHYESLGLLTPPKRSESGYRLYDEADLERLKFIQGAKSLGLSLHEIGEVIGVWSTGERPCGRVRRLLDEKLEALEHRIHELVAFRDALRAFKGRAESQDPSEDVPCVHIAGVAAGAWQPVSPDLAEPLKKRCH